MREIEIKFRVKDLVFVRAQLRRLGAKLLWGGTERTSYYDTRKGKLRKRGANLRIKSWPGHSITVTFKSPVANKKKGYKELDEFQVAVSSAEEFARVFRELGFVEWFRYKKRREHWQLGKAKVELDRLSGGRCFVEIEGSKRDINRLAGLLRLDWKNSTDKGYISILGKK